MQSKNEALLVGELMKTPVVITDNKGRVMMRIVLKTTDTWEAGPPQDRKLFTSEDIHVVMVYNSSFVDLIEARDLQVGEWLKVKGKIEVRFSKKTGKMNLCVACRSFRGSGVFVRDDEEWQDVRD